MIITRLKHRIVSVPVKYPVVSSVRQSTEIVFVLLDVQSDEGVNGISYAQAFHQHGGQAIQACLNLLETIIQGERHDEIEKIWNKMWKATKLLGHQGLSTFALSMIDIALWDLKGKIESKPVYELLGGQRRSLDTYMSDGLWLVSPLKAARQAEAFAMQGHKSMKMRLGRKNAEEDIDAANQILHAVGSQVTVLGDVNQGWSIEKSLDIGCRLYDLGIKWLEEPIDADDIDGHCILSEKLKMPITTGENLYGIRPFKQFLQANAAQVYTPDLQRIGGVTGWLKLEPILKNYSVQYSLHLFPEYAVHLLHDAPPTIKLEWMSWAGALFEQPLVCKEGKVIPPQRPGFGMCWAEDKRIQ